MTAARLDGFVDEAASVAEVDLVEVFFGGFIFCEDFGRFSVIAEDGVADLNVVQ